MAKTGQIYRLLAKIGIEGKKDVLFLCIFYLVALVSCILCYLYSDLPVEILWVVILFPPVFIGAAIILVAIKRFFIYVYNKLGFVQFILFCTVTLLLWCAILSFWLMNIDNKNTLQFITWLVPSLGIPVFLSANANIYLIEKYGTSKKGRLSLLAVHGLIILLLIVIFKISSTLLNAPDWNVFSGAFIFALCIEVMMLFMSSVIFCLRLLYANIFIK